MYYHSQHKKIECPRCEGIGKVWDEAGDAKEPRECRECMGNGTIPAPEPKK